MSMFLGVTRSDARKSEIDCSAAIGLRKIDFVNVVESVTDGPVRSGDSSKIITSATDSGVPVTKRRLKKKKKKASSNPDKVGPEGATHHHANGEDFNPHAHRVEYPEGDRDLLDLHKTSSSP